VVVVAVDAGFSGGKENGGDSPPKSRAPNRPTPTYK
jgi:hypothetical protein